MVATLTSGELSDQVADVAALPRVAVVVEGRYSQLFKLNQVRPPWSPTGSPSCTSAGPAVAVVCCEALQLAEE
jgi:hypothetical protein